MSVLLPDPFAPVTSRKPPVGQVDVDAVEHGLLAEAALEAPGADDHTRTSASTNAKNVRLITPFMVKNAVSSRRQSRGETSACS